MGTSVCLHSDELVSKRPLERAWHSPMTHSLLFLQDDTQCQPQPVPTVRWLWLQRGCCWLLSPSPDSLFILQVSGDFSDPGKSNQAVYHLASGGILPSSCGG